MESTNTQAGKSIIELEQQAMPQMKTEPSGETQLLPRDGLEHDLTQKQTRCIICLEDWVFCVKQLDQKEEQKSSPKNEENLKDQANFADLWKVDDKPQEIINRLFPCNHFECNQCFVNYHQKTGKLTCPVCQVQITNYSIVNTSTLTESSVFGVSEFASGAQYQCIPEENLFESFDHQYFEREIEKLISLRTTVEHERFHSRRNMSNHTSSSELEWQSLKQIEQRLYDIQEDIYMMELFNSDQRMREVHEIHETLLKIRAGKIADEENDCFGFRPQFDFNGFDDDLNDDDFQFDIKIRGQLNKGKPFSKQIMDPFTLMLESGKKVSTEGNKKQNKKNRKGKGKIMELII